MWVCGQIGYMPITSTSRLSIDVAPGQHKRLKALAALSGQSIKDYVIQRTLPESDEESALRELEALLKPRIQSARSGPLLDESVEAIFDEVADEHRA